MLPFSRKIYSPVEYNTGRGKKGILTPVSGAVMQGALSCITQSRIGETIPCLRSPGRKRKKKEKSPPIPLLKKEERKYTPPKEKNGDHFVALEHRITVEGHTDSGYTGYSGYIKCGGECEAAGYVQRGKHPRIRWLTLPSEKDYSPQQPLHSRAKYIPSQEKRLMSGVIPNYSGGNSDVMFVQW